MVVIGGGVSAMPSMHLAVAMIFVMATRKSHWRAVAVPFWLLIFILSAYFGYHYWIDGIVGSIIAMLCWLAAERLFEPARCARPSYPVRLRRVLSFPKAQIAG
jgi:membrane-associated phospholipid phosphatase